MTETAVQEIPLTWLSPADPPLQLVGFPWFAQDGIYRRLPRECSEPIPEAVDGLANNTAGGMIRFRTDSTRIGIKVKLAGTRVMYHITATGQSGFDLYLSEAGIPRYRSTSVLDPNESTYGGTLFQGERVLRNVLLHFPLYQGVEEVSVGVDEGAQVLAPLPFIDDRPIVVYGTSITQGGCANRPGMVYTNILSRRMQRPFVNLGFSGSGKGEPELARLMAAIPNPACLVLDHEANCESIENLVARFGPFVRILREAHPTTPILVISQIRFSFELTNPEYLATANTRRAFLREAVAALRQVGDRHIHFLDGAQLLGDEDWEECTVDGVHATDLGFWRMAQGIEPVLREILA